MPSLDIVLEKNNVYTVNAVFPWRKEKPKANSGIYGLTRFWGIHFAEPVDEQKLIEELLQSPIVRNAEAVWVLPIHASSDDPSWNLQWAIEVIPDTSGGANYLPVGSGLIIELLIKVDISAPSGKIEIDTPTICGQMMVISSVWGEYFPDTYIRGKIVVGVSGDANAEQQTAIFSIRPIW